MSRVRDIVDDRELFSVLENETVAAVARKMVERNIGAILVLSSSGDLRGVFSERDLMKRVVVGRLDPEKTPVSAVMSTVLATVDEGASLEEAMEMMQSNNCRHLPVLRGSRAHAFLSMRDLMHHELALKTEELSHMRAYIHGA